MADMDVSILPTMEENDVIEVNQGKRKTRNPEKWKDNFRKKARNTGEEYISRSGKVVPSKVFVNFQCCKTTWCEYKHLAEEEKNELFIDFYKLGDFNIQNAYLFGQIKNIPCKRKYAKHRVDPDTTRRHKSTEYYLKSCSKEDIRVCKTAFLSVHGISKKRLDNIKALPESNGSPSLSLSTPKIDKRGKHNNRPHACKQEDIELAEQHIKMFPKYRSHYSISQNPNKQYIFNVHSVEEMYRLYIQYCNEAGTVPLSQHKYRYIFNHNFNIGFKLPRSDTCKVCDEAANVSLEDKPLSHRVHLKRADMAYKTLTEVKKMTQNPACDTLVIAMDLEQALPTPMIATEVVFYLRQLWTYNFGVHVCNTNDAYMCVWPESIAGRGADEIGSCLLKVIPRIRGNMRKLIVYSDSCVGQNKNFPIMCIWIYMIEMGWFDEIEHRFLVPGHTYLPCDADFGIIEKLKRSTQYVYNPHEWANLIRNARKQNPFTVLEMQTPDFLNLASLTSKLTKRNKTSSGKKVDLRKASTFRFHGGHKVDVRYTYSDIGLYDTVSLQQGKGKPQKLAGIVMQPKYPNGRLIKEAKLKDILSILKFVPPVYHEFYLNLKSENSSGCEVEVEDIE